ncbi:GLPGLI family protein [Winogradskyella psychrotolerans]|uniref:GLPGLI family protein n=1 Tax=Winogradskyella psychrotolerans TaxID=1344585 RepID=UPI001C0762B6|nr:GLPGLI family protein [Winogradskyella psychrotolerans]MBU2928093.1 GLPGLI family protein [Winogradskyella psychrotolerans]
MVKKYFILLFFVSQSLILVSQTKGRIIYRLKTDLSDLKSEKFRQDKKMVDIMTRLNKVRDSVNINLDFNGEKSLFYVDKETNLGLSNERGYDAVMSSFKIHYRNDKTEKKIKVESSDKTYLVYSNTSDVVWEITKETKKIDVFLCLKATTKIKDKHYTKGIIEKDVVAWFCPEIPISLGPNNYGGLPGLIMELNEGLLTYYVKNVNLKPDFDIDIEKPKGTLISQKDYFGEMPTITKKNIKEYIGN